MGRYLKILHACHKPECGTDIAGVSFGPACRVEGSDTPRGGERAEAVEVG